MVNGEEPNVNPTDVYRVLNTGIHTMKCTETQQITEMTIFVFISDPDSTGSNKSKRCLLKHHVKSSESESINAIISTHSKMRDDHIYYDPVKNARFLDGENNPKDWAALWKMDVHCTGGHWAALLGFNAKESDDMNEDGSKEPLTVDEVMRKLERHKPDPVIKEPKAPSVPEPVRPLQIPTLFNIKTPKGVLKVHLNKVRDDMVIINTDALNIFNNDECFKIEVINDDQHLNTPAVRLRKPRGSKPRRWSSNNFFEASPKAKVGNKGTIKFRLRRYRGHYFEWNYFEASPKAKVGDKGTIKFSLERPATETEEHMRWITFVKFEIVSSEDDDCEPLCAIA